MEIIFVRSWRALAVRGVVSMLFGAIAMLWPAITLTALVLLFERNAADARQSERNRVISDLIAGRGGDAERVQLARAWGFDPLTEFCVLVMRGEDRAANRALVMSAGTATGEGALVGSHDGHIVALVPGRDPDTLAKSVAARLSRRSPVTVAGVGPVTGVNGVPGAHEEGARTARALIALGQAAGFSLDEIRAMFTAGGEARIDRALLAAKADELDRTIKRLKAMSDGLRHAAACPAPSHAECPTFRRLLNAAAAGAIERGRAPRAAPLR